MTNPAPPSHGHHDGPIPPTLCSHCKFGVVQVGTAPADERETHREPERFEIAYCSHPDIAGEDEPPREVEHVVLECQGFQHEIPTQATSSEGSVSRRPKRDKGSRSKDRERRED